MTEFIKEYVFKKAPSEIEYFDIEPLKLTKELEFFHNKNKFRRYITNLQNLVKRYLDTTLLAVGIRDTYLKEEFTEKFLILLFTSIEISKSANNIIESHKNREINQGCYYIENTSDYMLLLAKDMEGIKSGIETIEEILKQTLEHYFEQKNFDDYIKICPFKLNSCK